MAAFVLTRDAAPISQLNFYEFEWIKKIRPDFLYTATSSLHVEKRDGCTSHLRGASQQVPWKNRMSELWVEAISVSRKMDVRFPQNVGNEALPCLEKP